MDEPKLIGRYLIRGELGRGGMGIVFRAEDRLIGREVAIKTLTEVTPELRNRFYLEARSGTLSHPNIVTVYELGEHEENPFIAMELVAGESLERMLRTRKRLPLLESLSIVEQLCAGLGYAHGHGVVHRDVKPANVLVRPDGRVTIVDFGIAHLTDQTRKLTKTDAVLGTFHYIAPERLKGEPSDGRADIWSVGVMLYEMLTGELPFRGKDVTSLYRVIHEPYVPLTEYVQDLPEGLAEILERALAKQVQDRYETAEEMSFDLQVIAENLKGERVNTLLQSARKLAENREYANARALLLQAQRIDPRNADAKTLVAEVQERMNDLQRSEQLLQLVEQAQSALEAKRWEDAGLFLGQAQGLDTEGTYDIPGRLQEVQEQKAQQQRLIALWEQATDARRHGDLTGAQELLSEALRIDSRSTDLRNAYSVVVREIRRKQEGSRVEDLLRRARERYTMRQYTEAIAQLREATEIDPGHPDVQELLFTATTRQKEERRQYLLDKLAREIQESLDNEDLTQAQDRLMRALETLPQEPVLLQLQEEKRRRQTEREQAEIVRKAMLESQELLAHDPIRAMQSLDESLSRVPGNAILLQARARIRQRLPEMDTESERKSSAHTGAIAVTVTANTVRAHSGTAAALRNVGRSKLLYAGGAGVLVLGAVFLAHARHPDVAAAMPVAKTVSAPSAPVAPPTAAPVPEFDLEIDASPWATVVSVADASGKTLPLPPGDETTPLRIDGVKAGTYQVNIKGAEEGQQKTVRCVVTQQQHLCTVDLGLPDVQKLVKGERP